MTGGCSYNSMLKVIRDKIIENLEGDANLNDVIIKYYRGNPPAIPKYPAVVLSYDTKTPFQRHQGKHGRENVALLNITVVIKRFDESEKSDQLLDFQEMIEQNINEKRYLEGINNSDNNWRITDVQVQGVSFADLPQPKEFVIDAATTVVAIKTEGF